MTLTVTKVGTNDDGTPHYHHHDPERHAVLTTFAKGHIELSDGTVHNVADDWTFVDTHEQAVELAHHVATKFVAEGHPLRHETGEPHAVEYTPAAEFAPKKGK